MKYNDVISNTSFFVTTFLLTIIRRSKVLKKEIKTKHKANKWGWRESNKLSKKDCFFSFFLKVDTLTELRMSGLSELKNKGPWY